MKLENLIEEFNKINNDFIFKMNDIQTRLSIIRTYEFLIHRLYNEREIRDTLMKRFVDCSTPEIIDSGGIDIQVELLNNKLISIEEYCVLVTNDAPIVQRIE
jgi:hypothetical protein